MPDGRLSARGKLSVSYLEGAGWLSGSGAARVFRGTCLTFSGWS